MSDTNDPAFPAEAKRMLDGNAVLVQFEGLTKFEYFAAVSLMGIRARTNTVSTPPDKAVEQALADADAMMRALAKINEAQK